MGLFSKKKVDELESVIKERDQLASQIADLQGNVSQVSSALNLAKVEYMVDGSASTKKRVDKFETALEDYQKEIDSLNSKLQSVGEVIGKLTFERKQAEIEETANVDVAEIDKLTRARMLEKVRDGELKYLLHGQGIGNAGAGMPRRLLKLANIPSPNYFDAGNLEHKPFLDLLNAKKAEADKVAQAELEELLAHVRRYLKLEE